MEKGRSSRRHGSGTMTGALALLLVVCLAECASGSCLSYGHSCWGAHGKRSGKPPGAAPDWFLAKLFRHADIDNGNMQRRQAPKNEENNAIYQGDVVLDSPSSDRLGSSNGIPLDVMANRDPEAKPMLDDYLLSKIKLWQIMRQASEE